MRLGEDHYHFVFDVESVGLHGEGFAVGWVILQQVGIEVDSGVFSCDPLRARGEQAGYDWVRDNVPPLAHTYKSPRAVREAFSRLLNGLLQSGGLKLRVYAECPWPVEANFLSACVADSGLRPPYPLLDVSSLMLAVGVDPLFPYGRLTSELPEHHPLNDARQSARVLRELYLA